MNESVRRALEGNDPDALAKALEQSAASAAEAAMEERIREITEAVDRRIKAERGQRQLTSEERTYFSAVLDAMRSGDPRQAIAGISYTFPQSVINTVFEELEERHPLLQVIDFRPSTGNDRTIYDQSGRQSAVWGELCDEIVKELTAELAIMDSGLFKLSAFIFACKPGMELGAEWLDAYIRQILYDSLANGLEIGILTGTGKEMPIGMDRQVGTGVTVTDGIYPKKPATVITNFTMQTVGNLISAIAKNPEGKTRSVRNLVLICNDADYYSLVMPAMMMLTSDGSYRNILPYNIQVIPSANQTPGEANFGIASNYIATVGMNKDGRIEYSDEFRFLQDQRTYIIKLYANGRPKDANSFVRLDISGLVPATYKVEMVTPDPGNDATLSGLKIGNLTLSPAFDSETTEYTAATTTATNVITATPADASAGVTVRVGDTVISNGTAATWEVGENVVTIAVTAEDGTTTETYTVTVTKS